MNKASYLGILWPSRGRTFIHGTMYNAYFMGEYSIKHTYSYFLWTKRLVGGWYEYLRFMRFSQHSESVGNYLKEPVVAMSSYVDC